MKKLGLLAFLLAGVSGTALAADGTVAVTAGSGTNMGVTVISGTNYPTAVITDPTTPTQHQAVNSSGQASVQDSTLATLLQADPCGGAKTTLAISQTTSTQIISGTSAKKTYVCSLMLVNADSVTENVSLISGTASVCASTQAVFIGATTAAAGIALVTGGGATYGAGVGTVAGGSVDTAANNVCLLQSGTGRIAGVITYVQN